MKKKKDKNFIHEMNAVVRIHAKGVSEVNPKISLDPRLVTEEDWVGSGFFFNLKNKEGYVLTNAHVARNAGHIEIRSMLTSDEPFKVELVGIVDTLEPDVALLKFSDEELKRFKKIAKIKKIPTLEFADSKNVKRGEEIKAIGFPLGMVEPNISGGEITNFISGTLETVERIVTDAAINPGNSGGPAMLNDSKVIGLNTAIVVEASNIAFVTPIHIIENILDELLNGKDIRLNRLGAYVQKNSSGNAIYLKSTKVEGIIINRVLKKSLAEKAKLKMGDILLSVNGNNLDRHGNITSKKHSHKRNLFDILHSIKNGELVDFKVSRSGKLIHLKTTVSNINDDVVPYIPTLKQRKNLYFEGLVLQEVCSEILSAIGEIFDLDGATLYRDFEVAKSKIIITAIDEESQGHELDFHIGDYVTEVNGVKVKNLKDFAREMNKIVKKKSQIVLKTSCGAIGCFEI